MRIRCGRRHTADPFSRAFAREHCVVRIVIFPFGKSARGIYRFVLKPRTNNPDIAFAVRIWNYVSEWEINLAGINKAIVGPDEPYISRVSDHLVDKPITVKRQRLVGRVTDL